MTYKIKIYEAKSMTKEEESILLDDAVTLLRKSYGKRLSRIERNIIDIPNLDNDPDHWEFISDDEGVDFAELVQTTTK
tara:strand:+ start:4616 stop:4849 length:234 start_codon:yes stop_codon:yes gene_type:complete